MVAGIIVTAVGDELVIAHPFEQAGPATVATVLGGPALFLAGHLLFKRAMFGIWSIRRLAGIVVLAIVGLIGQDWAPLMWSIAALLIIAAISWSDMRTVRLVSAAGRSSGIELESG